MADDGRDDPERSVRGWDRRNAYGMWTERAPGLYDVCFGTVANKNTPPCQNGVPVTAGNTTTITGIYTPIP